MSRSDIDIGYWSDISQKTSIGFYRTASKISDISALISSPFSAPALLSIGDSGCWLLFSVWVTSLDQAFSNIPHYKISNKSMYDSCWYRIGSISANTQGCNIGIVSEVKKLYRDIPITYTLKWHRKNMNMPTEEQSKPSFYNILLWLGQEFFLTASRSWVGTRVGGLPEWSSVTVCIGLFLMLWFPSHHKRSAY